MHYIRLLHGYCMDIAPQSKCVKNISTFEGEISITRIYIIKCTTFCSVNSIKHSLVCHHGYGAQFYRTCWQRLTSASSIQLFLKTTTTTTYSSWNLVPISSKLAMEDRNHKNAASRKNGHVFLPWIKQKTKIIVHIQRKPSQKYARKCELAWNNQSL